VSHRDCYQYAIAFLKLRFLIVVKLQAVQKEMETLSELLESEEVA